jgi:hypothetical protein
MVGAAAVTVVGGAVASHQANKGASAAAAGEMAGVDEQRRQYDLSRQDQMPWLNAGGDALSQMQRLNAGDMTAFNKSPDYQFAFDQGMQGLDRSAAARGGLYSGGHSADLMKFGQGLASQNYNAYYNRLQSLANQGQTTGQGLGALGANSANSIQQGLAGAGNARASSYNNNAQFAAGTAGALGGLWQGYMAGRQQPTYGSPYAAAPTTASGANWQNAYGAGGYS